jgi:hypothetical protein
MTTQAFLPVDVVGQGNLGNEHARELAHHDFDISVARNASIHLFDIRGGGLGGGRWGGRLLRGAARCQQ